MRPWAVWVMALGVSAGPLRAQSVAERLCLDKLHVTALGVAVGAVYPAQVVPTTSYAVQADYGELAPHWRILFTAGYWGSRFTDEAVNGFVEQLRQSITDPAQDDTIHADQVSVSDIALDIDARYTPVRHTFLTPYASVGIGAHIVNAESALIQGTFVEGALDNIGTGLSTALGMDIRPSHRFTLGVQARYTLLANVRFATLQTSATYHFGLAPPPSAAK